MASNSNSKACHSKSVVQITFVHEKSLAPTKFSNQKSDQHFISEVHKGRQVCTFSRYMMHLHSIITFGKIHSMYTLMSYRMWNFKEGGKVLKNKIFGQKSTYLAPTPLQLPLRQWGAGNVYFLVLPKAKREIMPKTPLP